MSLCFSPSHQSFVEPVEYLSVQMNNFSAKPVVALTKKNANFPIHYECGSRVITDKLFTGRSEYKFFINFAGNPISYHPGGRITVSTRIESEPTSTWSEKLTWITCTKINENQLNIAIFVSLCPVATLSNHDSASSLLCLMAAACDEPNAVCMYRWMIKNVVCRY